MTARRGSDILTAAVVGMGYVGLPTAIALACWASAFRCG